MTSKKDDKLGREPGKQTPESPRDNVVPLMPRLRKKEAERAAGKPASKGDEDDPGPDVA